MTLDGYKYTFNGRGEFTLIEISNNSFTLQGRMVNVANQDGATARATVFSAIVAREGDSDVVQFEVLSPEKSMSLSSMVKRLILLLLNKSLQMLR